MKKQIWRTGVRKTWFVQLKILLESIPAVRSNIWSNFQLISLPKIRHRSEELRQKPLQHESGSRSANPPSGIAPLSSSWTVPRKKDLQHFCRRLSCAILVHPQLDRLELLSKNSDYSIVRPINTGMTWLLDKKYSGN